MEEAAVYCRVSSKEQIKNLSLATQREHCLRYCEARGWKVSQIFMEKGESAKTTNRTEFKNFIDFCHKNKNKVKHVVVYNLSRWTRSSRDGANLASELQALGIALHSVTEMIDETPNGKFMRAFIHAKDQLENDIRAERTTHGMQKAIELGRFPFHAPLGYKNLNKILVLDEESYPYIEKSFELLATGNYTIKKILEITTAMGLKTKKGTKVPIQTFQKIFRNPIYYGWLKLKKWKIDKQGIHQPIISKEVFDRVQLVLDGKVGFGKVHNYANPEFPLRRFIKYSKTGKPLTGSHPKGRKKHYAYYHTKGCNIAKERLETLFIELLEKLQPKPCNMKLFKAIVKDVWIQKHIQSKAFIASLRNRQDQLETKKNNLVDALVHQKVISKEIYDSQVNCLMQEIELVENQLKEASVDEIDIEMLLNFAEYILSNISRLWFESNFDNKLKLQGSIFPNGVEFDGEHFGTNVSSSLFNILDDKNSDKTKMVTLTGFEPVFRP